MRFGPVPLAEAEGSILAHAVRQGEVVLKKGSFIGVAEIERLRAAGVAEIVVARPDADDVAEDAAALVLAESLAGANVRVEKPFTGRSNLYAERAGVLLIDSAGIDGLNAVDESITVATLPANRAVVAGEMVGTVKIIPFSVRQSVLAKATAAAPSKGIAVASYQAKSVALVSTLLPGLKPSVVDKTAKVMGERLTASGSALSADLRVTHDVPALAATLTAIKDEAHDVVVVFGASAITDRQDVIPAAIEAAGGVVEHFGMPVDPGNLLLIGSLAGKPIVGAPGCARSPRENGFDWVLQRLMANVPVSRADIQRMGVGGLLMEIVSRPRPREITVSAPALPHTRQLKLAMILLAAGKSSRMGGSNKLLAVYKGQPLVRHAADALVEADLGEVIVVTGHQADAVAGALEGLPVRVIHNHDFAAGLSTSLKAGVDAAGEIDGVIVALGDMPRVDPGVIRRLAAVMAESPKAKAVVPTTFGERGNPVLISKQLLPALAGLEGDIGARRLIEAAENDIVEVAVDDANIHLDIDTPDALSALRS